MPIEQQAKLEFEDEIEPEKLTINKNSRKSKEATCSISYEPELINKNEIGITSEITLYEDITQILNRIPELNEEEIELQRKMLDEILTKDKADIHYENSFTK